MIQKLTSLLRRTAGYLEELASPMSSDTVLETEEQPAANAQTTPATTQAADTPPIHFCNASAAPNGPVCAGCGAIPG